MSATVDLPERGDGVDATKSECLDQTDLMFSTSADDVVLAKATCAGCSERLACLEGALLRREMHGTWGGVSEGELRELYQLDRTRRPA